MCLSGSVIIFKEVVSVVIFVLAGFGVDSIGRDFAVMLIVLINFYKKIRKNLKVRFVGRAEKRLIPNIFLIIRNL